MNKKVLSAILFGAMIAGTSTFTSCIDNEEPASIVTLRGAKAELLKAKAEVERAKVAQVQAEAEVARAQAALLQAQAEAEAAKAESDKALAAAQIAEAQAKAEQALAKAEAARKEAEAAYQKAILDIKKAQAQLVNKQQDAIQPFITAYDKAIKKYNKAVDAQTEAERALAKHISIMEEKEANKALLTRNLTLKVSQAEAEYAGEQAALETAKATLAEAQALEAHEYEAKAQAVLDKKNEIDLAVIDLYVAASETVDKLWNDGRFAELKAIEEEIYNLEYEKEYAVPAFKLDLAGGVIKKGSIEFEAANVPFNDILNNHDEIALWTEMFTEMRRDENNDAWTKEAIVVLEEALKNKKEKVAASKKAWAEAVAAFNTNKYNEADPTKISGYTDVTTALEAFNAAQTAVNTAFDAVKALETKKADENAMNEAKNENLETYQAAELAAKRAYNKATTDEALTAELAALQKPYDQAVTDASTAKTTADNAYQAALNAYNDALAAAGGNTTDATVVIAAGTVVEKREAAENAQDDLDEATDNLNEFKTTTTKLTLKSVHESTKKTAISTAWKAYTDANAAAEKVYTDKWNSETGTAVAALEAANATLTDKTFAADDAAEALIEASKTYNENAGYDVIDYTIVTPLLYGEWDKTKEYNVRKTIDTDTYLVLSKEAMMEVVIIRSNELFGTGYDFDQYHGPDARLVEIKAEEITAMIEARHADERYWTAIDYINDCEAFGLMGEELALIEKIRVANFWLTNQEWVETSLEAMAEADEALHEIYNEAEEAIQAKQDELEAAEEALAQDWADAFAPINEKRAELFPLRDLYRAYSNALNELRLKGAALTQADIDYYVATCESAVESAETDVYNAETKMLWAREILAQWNRGDVEYKEILEAALEDANTAVERATDAVENAQNRLNTAIEALEWTAAE